MFWFTLLACLQPDRRPAIEGDTDTDADADADSDADADADSDADADADSDADAHLHAPTSLDFGGISTGCDDVRTVRVENTGQAELEITDLSAGGAFTLPDSDPFSLAPGEHRQVDVRFAPVVEQHYSTPLHLTSDAGSAEIALIGEGVPLVGGQSFVQTVNLDADVLIVVDNSCSMTEEQGLLQNNIGTLLTELDDIGADYQIGVITTDMDAPAERGRFVGPMVTNTTPNRLTVLQGMIGQGVEGSPDERPLDAIGAALTPPQIDNANDGFLRTGAQVTAIVLTDEDDFSTIDPATFATEFESVQGAPALTTLSGLAGPAGGAFPCSGGAVSASPAPRIFEAAIATGGGLFDLCAVNLWDDHMRSLARAATGHRLGYILTTQPTDPDSIEVTIDGTSVPQSNSGDGWNYLLGTVFILGSWVPDAGQTVLITHDNSPTSCQ